MSSAQAAAISAQQFFHGASKFAVVGASADRNKYGNKVLVGLEHPTETGNSFVGWHTLTASYSAEVVPRSQTQRHPRKPKSCQYRGY